MLERSTDNKMKAIVLLFVTAILATGRVSAASIENKFVRKPGHYSLDTKGSMLTIMRQRSGSWSLTVSWRSGNSTSSAAPKDCLVSKGWFVFIEQPNRIWIYDGLDGGNLLVRSEKMLRDSSFSRKVLSSCPRKVWDALPLKVKKKYRKVEPDGPANGSQPIRSDTNPTSPAAGSRR